MEVSLFSLVTDPKELRSSPGDYDAWSDDCTDFEDDVGFDNYRMNELRDHCNGLEHRLHSSDRQDAADRLMSFDLFTVSSEQKLPSTLLLNYTAGEGNSRLLLLIKRSKQSGLRTGS